MIYCLIVYRKNSYILKIKLINLVHYLPVIHLKMLKNHEMFFYKNVKNQQNINFRFLTSLPCLFFVYSSCSLPFYGLDKPVLWLSSVWSSQFGQCSAIHLHFCHLLNSSLSSFVMEVYYFCLLNKL